MDVPALWIDAFSLWSGEGFQFSLLDIIECAAFFFLQRNIKILSNRYLKDCAVTNFLRIWGDGEASDRISFPEIQKVKATRQWANIFSTFFFYLIKSKWMKKDL